GRSLPGGPSHRSSAATEAAAAPASAPSRVGRTAATYDTVPAVCQLGTSAGRRWSLPQPAGATPASRLDGRRRMSAMVEFTLDGRTVSAPGGELLVHAAARHGTFIPTLCHDDKLDPYGGCRMCVVEV